MGPLTPEDVDARFAEIVAHERSLSRRARGYLVGRAFGKLVGVLVLVLGALGILTGIAGAFLASWKFLLGG